MDQLQIKMSQKFQGLTNSLKDIDYHIGVTTTDLDSPKYNQNGRLLKWNGTNSNVLTPQTPNADSVFTSTIQRKETIGCNLLAYQCPSGNEQPELATIHAIQQDTTANAGFFRDSVDLAVIILSNEDELSNGKTVTGLNGKKLVATKPQALIDAFQAQYHGSKKLVVHAIVIQPGDSQCLAEQRALSSVPGNAYYAVSTTNLVNLTGGSTFSICAPDYTQSLQTISSQVRKLISSFTLQAMPVASSVQVSLAPAVPGLTWQVDGNKVVFSAPPPAGTNIQITYVPQN
jgi:hypothetical protein